jgi:hypothetical protein
LPRAGRHTRVGPRLIERTGFDRPRRQNDSHRPPEQAADDAIAVS